MSTTWSSRFTEAVADVALRFSRSFEIDGRLHRQDIAGSIAHARMLGACGIIDRADADAIIEGLGTILGEFERGEFQPDPDVEDIHMAIERRLIALIGPAGGRLHTARSRNDQVALDERLFMRDGIDECTLLIEQLQRTIVERAAEQTSSLMPGYTHLQRAQPVLLGHHLLAWCEMLERDRTRLLDCRRRLNLSPLGSAALAGTSFPIDREAVATELGFDGVTRNSLDAVSDRDHLIELAACASILMMHLSRIGEELVLWSSTEFGFVEMSDGFATGSSIMPQKKNPDMAELVRGRTGRVYGALVSLLTTMKGLPLAYNRDMQEDKLPMFESIDTMRDALAVTEGMIATLTFRTERMAAEASGGYSTATEIADYLVRRGLPFRQAHDVTARVVAYCVERGCELTDLTLDELRTFSSSFDSDVHRYLDPATSVAERRATGSASPSLVAAEVERWRLHLHHRARHGICQPEVE